MTVSFRPGAAADDGVEHPSLVPAQLLADLGAAPERGPDTSTSTGRRRRVRRSVRDWVVDVTAFVASVLLGLVLVGVALSQPVPPPDGLLIADVVLGSVGCAALWLRRRWPVGVAVGLSLLASFSDMVAIACLFSLFAVAVHRRWPTVTAVTAVSLASFAVYIVVRPDPELPAWVFAVLGVVCTAAAVAWGMFVRARRQLVLSLRERAVRAESEQQLRVEQARHTERTRIAREMHDVLAHRLSLLSMHAGALEFRPDAPAAEVAQAAGIVRSSARQALEDLREVIGVLRHGGDGGGDPGTRPQPTLADVPALVEESRRAGVRVRVRYRVPELATVPSGAGRSAYRVLQEGLTNVRKHAPGTVASVLVEGGPGAGLVVELRNPTPAGGEIVPALPGGGTGLVGLLERVSLSGGHLEHGWTPDGEFRLRAELPWPGSA
ncbi:MULTISPECIES: sensor histidine kinase [unclassified Modestobacter]|uniref:sensor histidine kinase n=1 Tax=unclassified Modestobacter TaxID=2643866 RepID=UPI0022AAC0EC|nr:MULTISPECIES: histidine kinase [unclassified Modestobacter]MCZ2825909.1 histidine kinase [Modestobacter sp. VKM Ac-2981]MCZ2853026.1 histidine kinase [Modestobacter sp. VKM Ac-2982]